MDLLSSKLMQMSLSSLVQTKTIGHHLMTSSDIYQQQMPEQLMEKTLLKQLLTTAKRKKERRRSRRRRRRKSSKQWNKHKVKRYRCTNHQMIPSTHIPTKPAQVIPGRATCPVCWVGHNVSTLTSAWHAAGGVAWQLEPSATWWRLLAGCTDPDLSRCLDSWIL